jgi:hypothetical protein
LVPTPLAGVRLRPLGQLSENRCCGKLFGGNRQCPATLWSCGVTALRRTREVYARHIRPGNRKPNRRAAACRFTSGAFYPFLVANQVNEDAPIRRPPPHLSFHPVPICAEMHGPPRDRAYQSRLPGTSRDSRPLARASPFAFTESVAIRLGAMSFRSRSGAQLHANTEPTPNPDISVLPFLTR